MGWVSKAFKKVKSGLKSTGISSLLGFGLGGMPGAILGQMYDNYLRRNDADDEWQRNYEAQKEFAQNSIQWRTEDAKKAGLHPMAALGVSPSSYTPAYSDNGGDMGQANAALSMKLVSEITDIAKTLAGGAALGQASSVAPIPQNPPEVTHKNKTAEINASSPKETRKTFADMVRSGVPVGDILGAFDVKDNGDGTWNIYPPKDSPDAQAYDNAFEGILGNMGVRHNNMALDKRLSYVAAEMNSILGYRRYYVSERLSDGTPIFVDTKDKRYHKSREDAIDAYRRKRQYWFDKEVNPNARFWDDDEKWD